MSSTKSTLINTIQQLIVQITNFQEDSIQFKHAFDKIAPHLQSYNTVYVANKKEIDRIVKSLGEKFAFHGYLRQKKDLQSLYRTLVPNDDCGPETLTKLSVVKLLIELSESPTNNVSISDFRRCPSEQEEAIDWSRYLLEGIERWSPPPDDSSESDDDASEMSFEGVNKSDAVVNLVKESDATDAVANNEVVTLHEARSELRNGVQSRWFNSKKFFMKPRSTTATANLAILWQEHLDKVIKGLISIETPSIVTEYVVMREIVWQMHVQHSGVCFRIVGDQIEPACDVTVSSVRLPAFRSFLQQFVPYMRHFQALRTFSKSLTFASDDDVPNTYRSYNRAVETITKPMFELLGEIEEKIKNQETIYTLLVLAKDLRPILEPLTLLAELCENALIDFKTNSAVLCTTTLLSHLYKRLFDTKSKLEQDLYLTLYLHSLYQYLMIVNSWLGCGDLDDCVGEFVITDQGEFLAKDLAPDAREDPILGLICTQVLQIGKNVHLLRRLGKIKLFFVYTDNLYDAFIAKVLESVAAFFDVPVEECSPNVDEDDDAAEFIFPKLCPDDCKYYTEMDKLERLVDTSDGFLMKAFEPYFVKKPEKKEAKSETLYAKIQKLTKTVLPIHSVITNVFVEILEERYDKLGFMVKTILVHDYELEKHFVFLQNIFLFKDDMIFPFYKHLFNGMDSNNLLGNHAWLTSFLQDIIVDAYPSFYDKTSVELNDDWQLANDPFEACKMVNVKYRIEWPVNVIITIEQVQMYRELFQFILKIKWALYALNQLYFSDLEPKKKVSKSLRAISNKLEMLRFGLLNVFSSIQHCILGHVFSECSLRFSKELENAYDLDTLTKAHADFISAIYKCCCDFQEYERDGHGFFALLDLIRKLRLMWRNVRDVKYKDLCACEKLYWICHKKLDEVMNTSRKVYDF